MIVTGGENVYRLRWKMPWPATLPSNKSQSSASHTQWGETVHAVIVLRSGGMVTEEELPTHARESIAGYKVPKSIEFRTEPFRCRVP